MKYSCFYTDDGLIYRILYFWNFVHEEIVNVWVTHSRNATIRSHARTQYSELDANGALKQQYKLIYFLLFYYG